MILTNIFYLTINTQKRLSLVIWDNRFKAIIFMLTNSHKVKKVWP
ncbi:4-hydroxybenzoyl-CoA thioesterase [Lactiplantibacillus plantarum]|nr:4-hydroxybenzoyl-CoA thioesterase [Lactiplantibacillus plantarum]MCT0195835.1 4-hydroxybenzoyl-CoA thioesterase [Lactiplantibacillus plantarum]TFZ28996.1 4-hydroxybenzoyl-CoA thioesterase [Lactiplantibacillus plantarum]TXJ68026.1 4-hydroxybenzoyl-CoA thioesterase [Lactiplantibacillus plantarum]TXJ71357.1 4-hydroxybenzoyl-CoA thioesterase [Lactiplantibacillus plantarum]